MAKLRAKSNATSAIMFFNVIFISLFSFIVLAFLGFPSLGGHFRPFTEVLRRIWPVRYAENAETRGYL